MIVPYASDKAGVAALPEVKGWKSCRPGRVAWDESLVAYTARDILKLIPASFKSLVMNPEWPGADLVTLKSDISNPNQREVTLNYLWLKPVVKQFTCKVRLMVKNKCM